VSSGLMRPGRVVPGCRVGGAVGGRVLARMPSRPPLQGVGSPEPPDPHRATTTDRSGAIRTPPSRSGTSARLCGVVGQLSRHLRTRSVRRVASRPGRPARHALSGLQDDRRRDRDQQQRHEVHGGGEPPRRRRRGVEQRRILVTTGVPARRRAPGSAARRPGPPTPGRGPRRAGGCRRRHRRSRAGVGAVHRRARGAGEHPVVRPARGDVVGEHLDAAATPARSPPGRAAGKDVACQRRRARDRHQVVPCRALRPARARGTRVAVRGPTASRACFGHDDARFPDAARSRRPRPGAAATRSAAVARSAARRARRSTIRRCRRRSPSYKGGGDRQDGQQPAAERGAGGKTQQVDDAERAAGGRRRRGPHGR